MVSVDYKAEGVVFDIQRFSLNDGPGIRSIVFLKGCPLSCLWCCNPESQRITPDVMFDAEKCIGCGRCVEVCNHGAMGYENLNRIDRTKCVGCGECVAICPSGALTIKGEHMSIGEIIKVIRRDANYFRKSGGGVTISGGEPLTQWKFARELLKACKAQGWDTAMETTGYGSDEAVEGVFPYVDLVLLDVKSTNSEIHKKVTGVDNVLIRKNAEKISKMAKVIIRVPTIPTINAFKEEFHNIAEFARTLHNVDTIHILPYHTLGENKYNLLGKAYSMGYDIKPLPMEEAEEFKKIVQSYGLKCEIGG